MNAESERPVAKRMTPEAEQCFFGYYDICPWDAKEERMLYLRAPFRDREPAPEDKVTINILDIQSGKSETVAETAAWNFQQGCMLHWMPPDNESKIIFNRRLGDRFAAVELDLADGRERELSAPIAALAQDGKTAAGLNFARIARTRPGYGYAGLPDPGEKENHPENDGLFIIDTQSGESRLIVSMARIRDLPDAPEAMKREKMWFNHAIFNADATRLSMLARYEVPMGADKKKRFTALFTVRPDGSELRKVFDYGLVSHYDWRAPEEVVAWADLGGKADPHYYLYDHATGETRRVLPKLDVRDGHFSYDGELRRVVTDAFVGDQHRRDMIVYDTATDETTELGRFHSMAPLAGPIRCDLHPRWNRSYSKASFDSTHEGYRGMYVVEAGE